MATIHAESATTLPLARVIISDGNPLEIQFRFDLDPEPDPPPIVIHDSQAIRSAWNRIGRAFSELVRAIPARAATTRDLWDRLNDLASASLSVGQQSTNQDLAAVTTVMDAFQRSRKLGWPHFDPRNIPTVEVTTTKAWFPIEAFPAFYRPPGPGGEPEDPSDLDVMQAAEQLLGFYAVVRRVDPNNTAEAPRIANDPTLPIQLLRHAGDGFDQETQALTLMEDLRVDGPWPDADLPDNEFQRRVLDSLFEPDHPLTAMVNPQAAAIAHFACHCFTEGPTQESYSLRLSDAEGLRTWTVRWEDIVKGYTDRILQRKGGQVPRPQPTERAIVVLNACGSSKIDTWNSLALPDWFLANGHPAFLGTHARIPTGIAATFAELLYGFLLGGFTLGQSVVLARRELLSRTKSPLGIVYSLYGQDKLRVASERPHLLPAAFA